MIRRSLTLCLLLVATFALGLNPALTTAPAFAQSDRASANADGKTFATIVLTNGRTIEAEILEETDTSVKVRLEMFGIETTTTYDKSEIVSITRRDATGRETGNERDDAGGSEADRDDDDASGEETTWEANDETVRIYYAELEGILPLDVAEQSVQRIFDDADRLFGDIVSSYDGPQSVTRVAEGARDKNIVVFKINLDTPGQSAFGGINFANRVAPILREQQDQRGRRVVFWVDQALQGGAFVPLTSSELYFTGDGRLGGIGSLDAFRTGDVMVDEKLIGARLGVAEGYVIRAGYGENGVNLMRAMARPQFTLAVNTSGGRAETLLRQPRPADGPNWRIVSGPGQPLNLDADLALKLNVSKGTVDTIDQLAFAMGIDRNYKLIDDNNSERILDEWRDEFRRALDRVQQPNGEFWRDLADLREQASEARDRRDRERAIGRMIRKLREIRSVYARYDSYLDPGGQARASIDFQIEQLRNGIIDSRN
jgi:hypothetical protein